MDSTHPFKHTELAVAKKTGKFVVCSLANENTITK